MNADRPNRQQSAAIDRHNARMVMYSPTGPEHWD
jgi:hypothetical protein